MEKKFQIKYLGEASFLLGMKLEHADSGLILHQAQYIQRKLVEYLAENLPRASCPIDPKTHLLQASQLEFNQFELLAINYCALIGLLNYLSILTRPKISFAVRNIFQFLKHPGLYPYKAVWNYSGEE